MALELPAADARLVRPTILVVDDDAGVRESFRLILDDEYEIVDVMNDKFGLDLGEADQLLFDQFEESWAADEQLASRAQNNDFQNFRLVFDREFIDTVVKRMAGSITPSAKNTVARIIRKLKAKLRMVEGGEGLGAATGTGSEAITSLRSQA